MMSTSNELLDRTNRSEPAAAANVRITLDPLEVTADTKVPAVSAESLLRLAAHLVTGALIGISPAITFHYMGGASPEQATVIATLQIGILGLTAWRRPRARRRSSARI